MNISNKLTYICFIFLFGCSRTDANYDDCMLNNIKPNMSEQAVEAIQDSCLQKFLKPIPYTCVDRLMNKTELNNLQIYAGALKSKGIEFSVYNGNPNISLKTFTVSVSSKNFSDDQIYQVEAKNLVNPFKSQDGLWVYTPVPVGEKWSFTVISAVTCAAGKSKN
jgi:hypothetical protein